MAREMPLQHCANCGEELGRFYLSQGEVESCTRPECVREVNDQRRGQLEEARERAAADDFERYR